MSCTPAGTGPVRADPVEDRVVEILKRRAGVWLDGVELRQRLAVAGRTISQRMRKYVSEHSDVSVRMVGKTKQYSYKGNT